MQIRLCQFPCVGLLARVFSLGLLLGQIAQAGVVCSVTPSAVSNTFNGSITLQVTGLGSGDTVMVQKYIDANANGVIDAGDYLAQQFTLIDGQAGMVIGGVTNRNVPGDTDSVAGQITAKLEVNENDFVQTLVANYLFKVSSPTGKFAAVTASFAVTNFPYTQKVTGNVVSNGTSITLPGAVILLFPPARPGHSDLGQPLGGTVANTSGNYSLEMPAGSYRLFALRNNFVGNGAALPLITLGSGATVTTNLTLTGATATISGSVVDANNPSAGLPGLLALAQTQTGLYGGGQTDSNGNFTVGVQASPSVPWEVNVNSGGLLLSGYVDPNDDKTIAAAGATGVVLSYTKATALIYGSVKDSVGNPLAGIDVDANDNTTNNTKLYDVDTYTDANGKYVIGVVGDLGSNDLWYVNISNDSAPTNDLFSQPDFSQYGGTNIGAGQAVLANFNGLLATNHITGNVQYDGAPVTGVQVYASTTINGNSYQSEQDTDANGDYSLNVGNGVWNVSVYCCCGGSDSLDNLLGSGNYNCPGGTNINIFNDDASADFVVQPVTYDAYVSGTVVDSAGNPVADMNVFAFPNAGGNFYQSTTDGNGNYRMGVDAGSYNMQLNTDPSSGAPGRGLVSPSLSIDVTSGVNINNLTLVAQIVTGTIFASVTNTAAEAGVGGINVSTQATVNGTNYVAGGQGTDNSGKISLKVCNGDWDVFADCNGLSGDGYTCPPDQDVNILDDNGAANFTVSSSTAPLQILAITLPEGTNGEAYAQQFFATGGQTPYTWSIPGFSADPPANLNLAGDGILSGIISNAPGTYYFDVVVTDAASNSAEEDGISLTVVNAPVPLVITNTSLPNGTVGAAYTAQLGASGGQPGYQWSLATGSAPLPKGLSLSFGGLITGIPTTNKISSFKVQVTDANFATINKVLSLIINPKPSLSAPSWAANVFQMRVTGASNQNYTVQASTTLTNWSQILVTNNTRTNSFIVTDAAATNRYQFYRVVVGP